MDPSLKMKNTQEPSELKFPRSTSPKISCSENRQQVPILDVLKIMKPRSSLKNSMKENMATIQGAGHSSLRSERQDTIGLQ